MEGNNKPQENLSLAVQTAAKTTTNSKTEKMDLAIVFGISTIIALGAIVSSSSPFLVDVWAQQNPTSLPSPSTANHSPTDGYGTPEGHLTAIRHVFDDPSLRVQHYCKPNDKILLVCQLYDSNSQNGTLIGIEYIITADQYNSLPNREKPAWHYHQIEFATNRADAHFPDITPQKEGELLKN